MKRRGFSLTIALVVASIVAAAGLFGCSPAAHRRPAVKLPKPPSEKWMLATVVDCREKQITGILRDLRKKYPRQVILRRPAFLSAGQDRNLWFVTHNFKLPPSDSAVFGRIKNGMETYSLAQYYVSDNKCEVHLHQQLLSMEDQAKLRLGSAPKTVQRDVLARRWGKVEFAITKNAGKPHGPMRYGITALARIPEQPADRMVHIISGPYKSAEEARQALDQILDEVRLLD